VIGDVLKKLTAHTIFHRHKNERLRIDHIGDADDVRMMEGFEEADLLLEAVEGARLGEEGPGDDLARERLMRGSIAHEQLDDFVVAEEARKVNELVAMAVV
jgi:hypothetical protein